MDELKNELNLKRDDSSIRTMQLERDMNGGVDRTVLLGDESNATIYNDQHRAISAPNALMTVEATLSLTRQKRESLAVGATERRFQTQM